MAGATCPRSRSGSRREGTRSRPSAAGRHRRRPRSRRGCSTASPRVSPGSCGSIAAPGASSAWTALPTRPPSRRASRAALAPLLRGGTSYFSLFSGGASLPYFCVSGLAGELDVEWHERRRGAADALASAFRARQTSTARSAVRLRHEVGRRAWWTASPGCRAPPLKHEPRFLAHRLVVAGLLRELAVQTFSWTSPRRPGNLCRLPRLRRVRPPPRTGVRAARRNLPAADAALAAIFAAAEAVPELGYDVYVLSDHGNVPTRPFEELAGLRLPELVARAAREAPGSRGARPGAPDRGPLGDRTVDGGEGCGVATVEAGDSPTSTSCATTGRSPSMRSARGTGASWQRSRRTPRSGSSRRGAPRLRPRARRRAGPRRSARGRPAPPPASADRRDVPLGSRVGARLRRPRGPRLARRGRTSSPTPGSWVARRHRAEEPESFVVHPASAATLRPGRPSVGAVPVLRARLPPARGAGRPGARRRGPRPRGTVAVTWGDELERPLAARPDGRANAERIARVIADVRRNRPGCRRSAGPPPARRTGNVAEALASLTGMRSAFGPTMQLPRRAPYGNGILSRHPIEATRTYDLSVPGREPRGCLRADVEVAGARRAPLRRPPRPALARAAAAGGAAPLGRHPPRRGARPPARPGGRLQLALEPLGGAALAPPASSTDCAWRCATRRRRSRRGSRSSASTTPSWARRVRGVELRGGPQPARPAGLRPPAARGGARDRRGGPATARPPPIEGRPSAVHHARDGGPPPGDANERPG